MFAVGHALKVPLSILVAPPSADLWDNQTDENELGFTYDFVELLLQYKRLLSEEEQKEFKASLSQSALEQFEKLAKEAEAVHIRNKHKEKYPLNLNIL